MANLMKKQQNFLNPTDFFYNTYKNNAYFKQEDWDTFNKRGELDSYIGIVSQFDKLPAYDVLDKKWHISRADTDLRYAMLATEANADRTELKEYEIEVPIYTNPNGTVPEFIKDSDGNDVPNKIKEKVQMTEYDYLSKQFQDWVEYDTNVQRQEISENGNGALKVFNTVIGAPVSWFVEGVGNVVDNFAGVLGFITDSTIDLASTGKINTSWADYVGQEGHMSEIARKAAYYSYYTNKNGDLNKAGQIVQGLANSFGEASIMIAANIMLPGFGVGATLSSVVGQGAYYTGMFGGRVGDRVSDPSFDKVDEWKIVTEAAVQTMLDYAITLGMNKFLGGSFMDKVYRGIAPKAVKGGLVGRFVHDFLSEGLEESLQEYGSYLISEIMAMSDKEFHNEDFSFQTVLDAFVLGGLSSVIMNIGGIITTNKIEIGDKKFGKIKSWIYNANIAQLNDAYMRLIADENLSVDERAQAMSAMYNSFVLISKAYNALGDERVQAANNLIERMYNKVINEPDFVTESELGNRMRAYYARDYAQNVMSELNKLGHEYAISKISEIILNDDEVQKEIADAGITKIADFIEKADMPNVENGKKMKKLADDMNVDNVALTDGDRPIVIGDTLFVNPDILNTYDNVGIIRSTATQTIVKNIRKRLNKDMMRRIFDLYKQNIQDKRKANYNDAIMHLMFNPTFFKVCLATADQDMYNFLSMLDNLVEKASGRTNIEKLAYQQVVKEVQKSMKAPIIEYLINQQNARYDDLKVLTETEKQFIKTKRYSKDLANRILSDEEFKKLTDEDWNVINNRINYLQADKLVKDQIRKMLHSESANARAAGLGILDNEYSGKFFTLYNDSYYLKQLSPGNNWFNEFMKENKFSLLSFSSMRFPQHIVDICMTNYGKVDNESLLLTVRGQFQLWTQYNFDIIVDESVGTVKIVPLKDTAKIYMQDSINYTSEVQRFMQEAMYTENGSYLIPSQDYKIMRDFTEFLISGEKFSDIDRSTIRINQVIQNPDLYLKESIKRAIKDDYKKVNSYTTFMYLRALLLQDYETIMITQLQNGEYVFVDLVDAYGQLKDDVGNADRGSNTIWDNAWKDGEHETVKGKEQVTLPISYFIKSDRLVGPLADVKVILVSDKSNAGTYNRQTNTITVTKTKSNAFFKFVLLHEFQHAIQMANGMNPGLTLNFNVDDNLIADFEKHAPDVFKRGDGSYMTERKDKVRAIQWYLYNTSGEHIANLQGDMVAFVPTLVVNNTGFAADVVTPWGTRHTIFFNDQAYDEFRMPVHGHNDVYTELLSPKEYQEYYNLVESGDNVRTDDQEVRYGELKRELWPITNEYWSQEFGGGFIDEKVKRKLYDKITPEVRQKMLELMHLSLAPGVSFETFMNMTLPYARMQITSGVYKDVFLSVAVGETAMSWLKMRDNTTRGVLYVGTLKPSDIIGYVGEELDEALLSSKQVNKAKEVKVAMSLGELTVANEIEGTTLIDGDDMYKISYAEAVTTQTDNSEILRKLKFKQSDNIVKDRVSVVLSDGTIESSTNNEFMYNSDLSMALKRNPTREGYRLLRTTPLVQYTVSGAYARMPLNYTQAQYDTIVKQLKSLGDISITIDVATGDYKYFASLNNRKNNIADIEMLIDRTLDQFNLEVDEFISKRMVAEEFAMSEDEVIGSQPKEIAIKERKNKRGAVKRPDSERNYVNKQMAGDTNLKYYVGRYIAKDMQGFIKEASPTRTEPELYEMIVKGEISYYDINKYFRSHDEMNEYTFNLINKYFFKNTILDTKAKLEKFIALDIRYYYALNALLEQAGMSEQASKPMTLEAFTQLFEKAQKNPALKAQLDKLLKHAFEHRVYNKDYKKNGEPKFKYETLDIDENHMRTLAMRLMNGSIDSAARVIATARAIAMSYKYGEHWDTADVKKGAGSLDEATKSGKSGEDAGTRLDVVADEKSGRDFFDQAYDERVANDPNSVKYDVLIDYYGKKYRAQHTDWKTYSQKKRYQVAQSIYNKVHNMSQEDLDNRYKKIIAKQEGAKLSDAAVENDTVLPVKNVRKNLVTRIKSLGTTISNWISNKQWKNLPDKYKQYFDEETHKLKPEYYANVETGAKEFPRLEALRDDLRFISDGLQRGSFTTKKGAQLEERLRKANETIAEQKQQLRSAKLKAGEKEVTIIETKTREFTTQSQHVIPEKLQMILESTFDEHRKSTVKFLATENDYNTRINAKKFYQMNADILNGITTSDIEEIINFYDGAILVNATDASLRNFKAYETLLLAYFIEQYRNKAYPDLDPYFVERAEDILKTKATISATELSTWRSVMRRVDPNKVIIQAMASKFGIDFEDSEVTQLRKAVQTGNLKTIENAQRKLYNNALKRYKGNKVSLMDKILKFQKAMMLSNPATAVRNQVSNAMLYKGNQLADFLGNLVTKKSTRPEQFQITGVKVSEKTANFVKTEFLDSGFFNLISDGLSKYDTRRAQMNIGGELIVDMIATGIATEISYNNTYNKDMMNTIINTIFKFQTDDLWIRKTAIRYIGKLLEQQQVDIDHGKTSEVLEIVAEGYTRAAMDYMHRSNVFNSIEAKFRETAPKAFFGYKLLFPFMPSAWNWFVESLNWTPLGLAKNIVNLIKVEKTITDLENRRMKGEPVMSPRFAEAMAKRGIGKGIIGSFVMGLGMLLGALGVVGVDDKDDKLKLKFGNVYVDIANIFGTSSFIVGAELMNPRKGNAMEVLKATFTALIEDSWFNDIANMFSYGSDSAWDVLLDKTNNLLTSFIPNFVKSFSKLLYNFDIKYDSGFLGNLQFFAAQIPGVAYALPKKINPYTGEVQSTYGLPFFADFAIDILNQWLPFKIQPRVYTKAEKIAMSLNVNKGQLTGEYKDIGKVDFFALNTKYGELNKTDLEAFINNRTRYDVQDDKGVLRKNLSYNQMTDEQRKTVIERIMSNNGIYAKIYAWTSKGHKYYTNASEYSTLKKLGISKGVFKGDKGFVS